MIAGIGDSCTGRGLELGDDAFGDDLGVFDEVVDGVEHDHVEAFVDQRAELVDDLIDGADEGDGHAELGAVVVVVRTIP